MDNNCVQSGIITALVNGENFMEKQLDVRIVALSPMRVASACGFGPEPEGLAWTKLLTWARQQGLGGDFQGHRFFGFNNPSPTPGSPNYGYEQWITTEAGEQPEGDVTVKVFEGGLYAVARCQGPQNIYETWKALLVWCENSRYTMAPRQCLEECLSKDLIGLNEVPWDKVIFDLYLSIAE
jgi:DNA gyrase inhibitor GyrI